METELLAGIIVAVAAPLTTLAYNLSKLCIDKQAQQHTLALAKQKQEHEITFARTQQTHDITSSHLDRALNPKLAPEVRQQVLRYLSTKGDDGKQLERWAQSELATVDVVVENISRAEKAVHHAQRRLLAAANEEEVTDARAALEAAVAAKDELPAARPPVTPEAIRAGFYRGGGLEASTELVGIRLDFENLTGADLKAADLSGASLIGCDLSRARLDDAVLRGASLRKATLAKTSMRWADLRNADLRGADLRSAELQQAHLEGANLAGALLPPDVQAVYDSKTIWPDDFDPKAAGAVPSSGRS